MLRGAFYFCPSTYLENSFHPQKRLFVRLPTGTLWFCALVLLAATMSVSFTNDSGGGSGKAAYRNYFMGNYYYNEAQPKKALGYFRKAYQAASDRVVFAMAYALSLAETGKPEIATSILSDARRRLPPLHPDYQQQLILLNYVDAIVQTKAGRYTAAQNSIRRAVSEQEKQLDNRSHKRLSGMYNLMAYLKIISQESPRSHAGLSPHVHLQERELKAAFPFYEKAVALDSSRQDAKQNLQQLADTLQVDYAINHIPKTVESYDRLGVYNINDYPHLPDDVESLLAFGHYDELIYLVDISGSMVMETVGCIGADRFTVMKEAAEYLLDFLPDSTQAGLATIGGECENEPDWWIATDSFNRKDLRFEIANLNSNGTTPLLTTLLRTPELFSDNPNTTKSIFFISDGENVCALPGIDICEWAEELANQNIVLNVLTFLDKGLNNSGAFAEYACLADRSGGQVRYLDPVSCSVNVADFDLVDRVVFYLPKMERVKCWGKAVEKLWAIYTE